MKHLNSNIKITLSLHYICIYLKIDLSTVYNRFEFIQLFNLSS